MNLLSNGDIVFNFGIVLLYIIIIIQIFFNKDISDYFIIFEIASIIFLFFYRHVINVPLYFGGTDILIHNNLDLITYLTNHVIPSSVSVYAQFPLYHIFCAEGMNILNLSSESVSDILTWLITAILIIPILYSFFRFFTKNRQILLFSLLILSITFLGSTLSNFMIPRGFAFFGFFLMLYILFKMKNQNEKSTKIEFAICLFPVMIFIILIHNVSTILIMSLIIILLLCEFLINDENFLSNKYVLIFLLVSIAYWLYCAFELVGILINTRLMNSLALDVVANPTIIPLGNINSTAFYINNVGSIIEIFLLVLGILYCLKHIKVGYLRVLGLFCFCTILLYINNPLKAVWEFSTLFSADRFRLLLSPFMSVVMGLGLLIFYLYLTTKFKNNKITFLLFFCIAIIFIIGTMQFVYNDMGVPQKDYFDVIELKGYNFVYNYVPYNGFILTDYFTQHYFNLGYFESVKDLGIPYYSCIMIPDIQSLSVSSGYSIISIQQFYQGELIIGSGNELKPGQINYYYPSTENVNTLKMITQRKNKIYTDSAIETYLSY